MREILQLDVVVDLNRAQTEYESKWLENPAESNDFPDELSEKIRASARLSDREECVENQLNPSRHWSCSEAFSWSGS
jgi:hypothetical protein